MANIEEDFWYRRCNELERRAILAETTLQHHLTGRDLLRAGHVAMLGERVKKLRLTIRNMQEKAEYFNNVQYATGLIVNCTGCDRGGPDHFENLTEEKVQAVEMLARRLRTWWNNHNGRKIRSK